MTDEKLREEAWKYAVSKVTMHTTDKDKFTYQEGYIAGALAERAKQKERMGKAWDTACYSPNFKDSFEYWYEREGNKL